jgi:hypothetical protein
MFANVLNQITGRLDSRFILTLFFPSLLFWGGLTAVYFAPTGLETALAQWRTQNTDIQIMQIILALAWVTFFAHLLSNQLVWLTKQFEGYWDWFPMLGSRLADRRRKHYQQELRRLDDNGQYEPIYYGFPFPDEPEEVMPTRLGNVLKNAEQYSYKRYDMDAVLLWPRLYSVLPENFMKSFEGAKASLDFMLVFSSLSVLFALVTGIYLLIIQGAWWLFLLCFLGGLAMARLAYKSALEAAITYGQLIKSAFDLYKGVLCKQLGYEQPKSLAEERDFWRNLYDLVYRGEAGNPEALRYLGVKETQPTPPTEPAQAWLTRWLQSLFGKGGAS